MTVEDRHSVVSVLDELRGKCGSVEILVNNAAISGKNLRHDKRSRLGPDDGS